MKLRNLFEQTDVELANLSTRLSGGVEKALVDDEEFTGKPEEVEFELNTSSDIEHTLVTHSHPSNTGTVLDVMPSEQDLISTVDSYEYGYPGSIIVSGDHAIVIKPKRENINVKLQYQQFEKAIEKSIQSQDIDYALEALHNMGFEAYIRSQA